MDGRLHLQRSLGIQLGLLYCAQEQPSLAPAWQEARVGECSSLGQWYELTTKCWHRARALLAPLVRAALYYKWQHGIEPWSQAHVATIPESLK